MNQTNQNIRILSLNIHKGVGWFKKPTLSKLKNEVSALHPDVILLQETRNAQFEYIAGDLWPHQTYGKNVVSKKGHHGNAILSKFKILESENLDISHSFYDRRGLLYAAIELQSGKKLHLMSVHLGLLRVARHKQLSKIINFVHEKIPSSEPLILGGDFNDWRKHASKLLVHELGVHEAFANHHGSYAKTYPAWAPLLCLDRVYARGLKVSNAERLMCNTWKKLSDHVAINVSLMT